MKNVWNSFSSLFNIDVGVGQGLALSPILSALYISPVLYIFEKYLKTLKIPIFFLSFVDNWTSYYTKQIFFNIQNLSYSVVTKSFLLF